MIRGVLCCMLLLALFYAGCKKNESGPSGPTTTGSTYTGASVPFASGAARTWVSTDANNQPTSLGVTFSATALTGFPSADTLYTLSLPSQASMTAFDHVSIDWNAHGHPPAHVYDVPHLDFHFYIVPVSSQDSVQGGPDSVSIPSNAIPPGYASDHMAVPRMGVHYIDTTSAEFHGAPFTKTFVFGYSHGRMTFLEPMVAISYLAAKSSSSQTLRLPAVFPRSGVAYPTSYSVRYDSTKAEYTVSLDGLTKR